MLQQLIRPGYHSSPQKTIINAVKKKYTMIEYFSGYDLHFQFKAANFQTILFNHYDKNLINKVKRDDKEINEQKAVIINDINCTTNYFNSDHYDCDLFFCGKQCNLNIDIEITTQLKLMQLFESKINLIETTKSDCRKIYIDQLDTNYIHYYLHSINDMELIMIIAFRKDIFQQSNTTSLLFHFNEYGNIPQQCEIFLDEINML